MGYGIEVSEILLSGVGKAVPFKQSFTDTQIKAFPTTPVTFTQLPAPGTDKRWVIVKGLWRAVIVTAYTNISANSQIRLVFGNNVYLANTPVTDGASPAELSLLIATTGTRSVPLHEWTDQPQPAANVENLDIRISINNAGGNLTGGNAGNSLTVSGLALAL